jgi:hypothetical protein
MNTTFLPFGGTFESGTVTGFVSGSVMGGGGTTASVSAAAVSVLLELLELLELDELPPPQAAKLSAAPRTASRTAQRVSFISLSLIRGLPERRPGLSI